MASSAVMTATFASRSVKILLKEMRSSNSSISGSKRLM